MNCRCCLISSARSGSRGLRCSPGTDDTRFSFSLGAGLKVPVTPRFGIRLEARGFLTLVDSDSAMFCASGLVRWRVLDSGEGVDFHAVRVDGGSRFRVLALFEPSRRAARSDAEALNRRAAEGLYVNGDRGLRS